MKTEEDREKNFKLMKWSAGLSSTIMNIWLMLV